MFRLFRPLPSLLCRVIETAKELNELSPVKYTRPSFSNLTKNSILLLSFTTSTAASWVCFIKNDIPYSFECQQFFNGYDLQGNLLNLLNQSSDIILTNATECLYYRNDYEYFGSNGYGNSLCKLGYPRLMVPDPSIIGNLQNNTPTHKFGTVEDVNNTSLISALGLTGIGLFAGGACLLKRYFNSKNNANTLENNEATALNPDSNNPRYNA
jgi:hypothetical protein